jgi:NCS2 family nucleobase:cation symporter-2
MGINYNGEPIRGVGVLIASITLMIMVGVNVWSRGRLRLYSVLIGLVAGYAMSVLAGLVTQTQVQNIRNAPFIALPFLDGVFDLSFNWGLLPSFLILSVTGALKSFGNLIMCEKVNDEDWKEPDIGRIGDGLMADSACVTISGLLGGMASDTSASNVALSNASGATSRYIGFAAGGIFILLAFFPKIAALFTIMPMPVMGAILVFVTCYMITSGIQIILASGVDQKKTFVIGIALVFGLSLDLVPGLYADVPHVLRPLFDSPLTLSTVLAVLLNQVLKTSPSQVLPPSDP